MPYNYKDLTYIRAALQQQVGELSRTKMGDCSEEEYSEIQNDILYLQRLIALTELEIRDWESRGTMESVGEG